MKREISRAIGLLAAMLWIGTVATTISAPKTFAQSMASADNTPGDEGANDLDSSDPVLKVQRMGGHWSGTINDNSLGAGTLDLTVAQSGKGLHGGFDVSFASSSEDLAGAANGGIDRGTMNLTLRPNRAGCTMKAKVTILAPTEITGTYSLATPSKCSAGVTGGSFDLILEHS